MLIQPIKPSGLRTYLSFVKNDDSHRQSKMRSKRSTAPHQQIIRAFCSANSPTIVKFDDSLLHSKTKLPVGNRALDLVKSQANPCSLPTLIASSPDPDAPGRRFSPRESHPESMSAEHFQFPAESRRAYRRRRYSAIFLHWRRRYSRKNGARGRSLDRQVTGSGASAAARLPVRLTPTTVNQSVLRWKEIVR